ncbi:MAG: ATP cone domain-containing protein, partial [Holosporales bacterium]
RVQLLPLKVQKKNDTIEVFDRDKLARSVQLALHKRPVEAERIERVISSIVRQLEARGELEIPSTAIGEMVMEALQDLDSVAYVRFASIYRDFHVAEDFSQFIGELKEDTKSD